MSLKRLTDSGRLVDVEPLVRPSYTTGTELELAPDECPECRHTLIRASLFQDSLVRHGGYGGTTRVDTDSCPCGFERVVAILTERPPR